jgi:hypothetical protein
VNRETLREALIRSVSPEQLRRPVPRALAPPLGRLLGDVPRMESCMAGPDATSSKLCELGDPMSRRTLVVLGDSHAMMWMPAFEEFAAATGGSSCR